MPIPFEEFMQQALHDPRRGYYARHIPTVGGRGDFTTAPMLSEHLAKAIAGWAVRAMRETKCRHLVEFGPGTGELILRVWKHLPLIQRLTTTLHLVETSEKLTTIQMNTLHHGAEWHRTPEEALAACKGRAVIFSNELVDAFAVRRFRRTTGGWREMAVELGPQGAVESLLPDSELPPSSIFSRAFEEGQCVEVHDRYRQWLQAWLPQWKAGRLLTIDYGAEAHELYTRQPGGSVRAYLLQQRLTGPAIYENVGRQDLTADVNFRDLIDWSMDWTADSRLSSLAEFLQDTGAPSRLTDTDGAGRAFRVLDQACRHSVTAC